LRLFPREIPRTAERARSIREFDDLYTAPFHGFRDAADYYARCSAGRYVDAVEIPALLIQSRDDPLVPIGSLPAEAIRANRRLELRLTDRGGHVGFVHRRATPGANGWLEAGVAEYLAAML
jgi:predicted alpha/beta-fold hydrolase